MELIKKNIHMEHQKKLAFTQLSLEEDQNISDQKPDALKIIQKSASVKVEEAKPVEETIWIKGVVNYTLLYLTDEKEKRLCSMEGYIPFEEKVYTDVNLNANVSGNTNVSVKGNTNANAGAGTTAMAWRDKGLSGDSLRVFARVEDLTLRLINSRKINIRSIIGLSVTQDMLYDEEVAVDVENPLACEILKKPLDITTIVLCTKDIYRIREEISLPDGFPNIYSLLWKDIRVDGVTFTPMEGRIGISGEINAFFMYEGEEEEVTPRAFEVCRPFSGVLDVPDCEENMHLRMDYEMEPVHVEIKPDYDGEERLIDLDIEVKLYIKLYRNMTLSLVADAYGIQEKMTPLMKECQWERILRKESGKLKVGDVWEDMENTGEELQILHTKGVILEEEIRIQEEEATLSGIIHTEMLCCTGNENDPYRSISMDLPYEHVIAVNGAKTQSPYYGNTGIEQITATVMGKRIEVRVMLTYQVLVYQMVSQPLLMEMKKADSDFMEKALPVMSVYFSKERESIWEVGKKYQVPLSSIRELNQLTEDELHDGQKILIAKERM